MSLPLKSWPQRVAFLLLAAAGAYFFLHPLLHAIETGASFVLYLVLSILGIVILPAFVLWFVGFAWWFIRPYFRAWHINQIRNNRLLREASDRESNHHT